MPAQTGESIVIENNHDPNLVSTDIGGQTASNVQKLPARLCEPRPPERVKRAKAATPLS